MSNPDRYMERMVAGEAAACAALRAATAARDHGLLAAALVEAGRADAPFHDGFVEVVARAAMAPSGALTP